MQTQRLAKDCRKLRYNLRNSVVVLTQQPNFGYYLSLSRTLYKVYFLGNHVFTDIGSVEIPFGFHRISRGL
jgi:hypothetical protein